jgi:hypothetical protein
MLQACIIERLAKIYLSAIANDATQQNGPPQARANTRREKMKTMLLAAAAALSLGVGSAYADSEGGTIPNSWFTELPGVAPSLPVQQVPSAVAANQNGAATHVFVTGGNRTTALFGHDGNASSGG